MTAAMAMPGNTAETFLVHFFGTGLADDRYVVERFKARADGDIVPAPAEALAAKGRRKVKRTTATLKAVKELSDTGRLHPTEQPFEDRHAAVTSETRRELAKKTGDGPRETRR